jgi:hypothetical protein
MTRWIPDSSACQASLSGSIPLTLQNALRLFSASVIDLIFQSVINKFGIVRPETKDQIRIFTSIKASLHMLRFRHILRLSESFYTFGDALTYQSNNSLFNH